MTSTHSYLNPQLNKSVRNKKRLDFLASYLIEPNAFETEFEGCKVRITHRTNKVRHHFWVRIDFEASMAILMMHVRGQVVEELLRLKGLS